jgi:ABC-type branched-subunit amino acid transport system substrate-binding protein
VAAFLGLALAACGTGDKPETEKPTASNGEKKIVEKKIGDPSETDPGKAGGGRAVRVALLLPLSGKYERIGTAMRKAAEMAVFEVGGKNFQLIPIDTQGTPDGATAAMDRAISQRADLVLGPLFSANVQAVKARAEEANIKVIAFSNDVSVAGGPVYLISFVPRPQVHRIISYAAQQGRRRIAILAPQGAYGDLVIKYAQDIAPQFNAEITRVGRYGTDPKKLSDEVRAFAGVTGVGRKGKVSRSNPLDFDAVLIPDGGQRLRLVSSLLAYYEVDPDKIQFLGTGRWDSATSRVESTLKGGWFAAPPPDLRERFVAKYREANKARPPRLASLAYDAVALAATLARNAPADSEDPVYSTETITSASGFLGIDGIFRFSEDGTAERGLAVLEVTPEEFRVISSAPSTFAKGTN